MEKDEKLKSKVLVLDSRERVVIVINFRTAIPYLELNRYLFHSHHLGDEQLKAKICHMEGRFTL